MAVSVRDPEAAARTLAEGLGLGLGTVPGPRGDPLPALGIGPTTVVLLEPSHPFLGTGDAATGVHHVALAAADPARAAEAAGLGAAASPEGAGLGGGREVRLDPAGTGGIAMRLATPVAGPGPAPGARCRGIDHVGVACADNRAAAAALGDRLGCPVESTQTDVEVRIAIETFTSDRYGVVHHAREPEPVGGLRVTFLALGDTDLELLEPFDPDGGPRGAAPRRGGGAGDTAGDRGAIARYLERRGPGLHHLALATPDVDGALAALGSAGARLLDARGRPGSRRARIGFVHPASLGGLLVHLVER